MKRLFIDKSKTRRYNRLKENMKNNFMKRRIYILVLMWFAVACAGAETIVLRTGARVKGTIVFENEEVVIIRDESGARFQYLRSEVERIIDGNTDRSTDRVQNTDLITGETSRSRDDETSRENGEIQVKKKATIGVEIAGGGVFMPGGITGSGGATGAGSGGATGIGGGVAADLMVGSHHIGERHIFIGGGFGYHGSFMGGERYNFLPVQAALRMPLMERKHAPFFGVAIGYGIALSKAYQGGIYAGLDFGYRCQLNPKTAMTIGGFAQFQQATVQVKEVIDGIAFMNKTGRNIVTVGGKIAFFL